MRVASVFTALSLTATGLVALACGGKTTSTSSSSLDGDYTNCLVFPEGEASSSAGADASVSISTSGSILSATFATGGVTSTLGFTRTAQTAATLAPDPPPFAAGVSCVTGPLDFAAATLSPTAGSLTFDSDAVFLSLVGPVAAVEDAGAPCAQAVNVTSGTLSIVCQRGDGAGTPATVSGALAATPPPAFPTGTFTCDSDVVSEAPKLEAAAGGNLTLTLSRSGNQLAATLSDPDDAPSGTLAFVVTSATSASPAEEGQSLLASCLVAPTAPTTQPLTLTAASLTSDGDTVFLDFGGAFGAECENLASWGNLTCTKSSP